MEIKKIGVVDLETTGLNSKIDSIVEIAVVSLDLETGEVETLYNQLVKETEYINEYGWIFENSDLSPEKVNNAQPLEFLKLASIFVNYPMTAYNKNFDISFLRKRGFKISNILPCPMKILTPICKIPSRNFHSTYKYPSFKEAWAFTFPDKKYKQSHRALDDATHEAQLIFELYKRGIYLLHL